MPKKSISIKKIFFITYLFLFAFFLLFHLRLESSRIIKDLSAIWSIVIFDAIFAFIIESPFLLIIRYIKNDKKVKFESLSKTDFINNKEYYRDILKRYSVAELSYIDDFDINYSKDIIVTLLCLKLKGKISIENNYITILDFSIADLKKSEIYVFENIKDGKVNIKYSHDIMKYVISEAIDDNLIKKVTFNEKNIISKSHKSIYFRVGIIFLIMFFSIFYIINLDSIFNGDIISVEMGILILFMVLYILSFSIPLSRIKSLLYINFKNQSYERTDVGEEVNKKIEGLKNFIKDFSVLDESGQQELILWEEYLLYSVLFNQNQKVIDELSSLVEVEYDDNKIYIE